MRNILCGILNASLLLVFFPSYAAPTPATDGETPASLSCVYGLTSYVQGCPISLTHNVPNGGSGIIAVIEGGDDPDAYGELSFFSQQFGLKQLPQCSSGQTPCFQTYYASNCSTSGTVPKAVTISEPQIDIEWAHAMAPNASIYMIETSSFDIDPMMQGVQCANTLLRSQGGYISVSDSFSEFAGEAAYDSNFQTPGITYVASSGDYQAPARYPAASPYVIAAGGTMINRDASGNYVNQATWFNSEIPCDPGTQCKTGGSGGPSLFEPRPAYQNSVQKIVGSQRGTPDFSFVAQGVDVFCCSFAADTTSEQCCARPGIVNPKSLPACQSVASTYCPSTYGIWIKTGGTSLAAPALTGILNSSHSGATSSTQELTLVYNNAIKNYNSNWTDITSGNNGFPALQGYDFDTGLGVPLGYGGK